MSEWLLKYLKGLSVSEKCIQKLEKSSTARDTLRVCAEQDAKQKDELRVLRSEIDRSWQERQELEQQKSEFAQENQRLRAEIERLRSIQPPPNHTTTSNTQHSGNLNPCPCCSLHDPTDLPESQHLWDYLSRIIVNNKKLHKISTRVADDTPIIAYQPQPTITIDAHNQSALKAFHLNLLKEVFPKQFPRDPKVQGGRLKDLFATKKSSPGTAHSVKTNDIILCIIRVIHHHILQNQNHSSQQLTHSHHLQQQQSDQIDDDDQDDDDDQQQQQSDQDDDQQQSDQDDDDDQQRDSDQDDDDDQHNP